MRLKSTAALLGLLFCGAAMAQDPSAGESGDPILNNYASTYKVSLDEARARLGRLKDISAVEKQLTEKFPNQFGGLYVVHAPTFKVVVKMTGNGQGLLQQVTSDPLYVVEKAETPVKQLYQLKERVARRLMNENKAPFSVGVNVWDGTVEIYSTDVAAIQALLTSDLQNNKNLRLLPVAAGPQNTATIYGGRQLTGSAQSCTSGFDVTSDSGPGIITAGHCDSTMTQSGVSFSVVSRAYKNSDTWGFDVQFMRPSGTHTFPNETYKSSTAREVITSTYYASDLPLDWPVCAYGVVTNTLRCGKLKAKWEVVRDNRGITGSFFRAAPDDGRAFNTEGDSGGPVLGANTAYGIIKGKGNTTFPTHLYFMDLLTLEAYGGLDYNVRIKTTP